jgi:hypothetical protein
MIAFLQTYGIWILIGIFFVLMMRMHSGGMQGHGMGGGCGTGMSHDEHEHDEHRKPQAVPLDDRDSSYQRVVPLKDEPGTSDVEGASQEEAYTSPALYERAYHQGSH